MRRLSPLLPLTATALIALLAGCRAREKGTETGARTSGGTAAAAKDATVPITTSSDEARTLYLRGRELSDQLRAHDARKLFQEAAAKDPRFALPHYDLAVNSAGPKEFLDHLTEAVRLSGQASEGERLMILALQAGSTGDSRKSLEHTEELVAKYPGDPRALALLGIAYTGVQDYEKAVEELTRATELDPGYAPAYNLLGYAYMPQRKFAEAEAAFKKYIALVPGDPNPYDSYAELLLRTGRFDESIAQYRKALSVEPHFSNSYLGIASNLTYQGKHAAAAAELQKLYDAARDDGDRRNAMLNRVVVFVDQGKTAEALREMDRLYGLDAKLGDTSAMSADAQQMGDILVDAGRAGEAAKRYRHSLTLTEASSLSPEIKDFAKLADHANLARVALAERNIAGAKRHAEGFRKGAEATGDVGRIRTAHELLGLIALQEKDYDGAVTHLGEADQTDAYVLSALAAAYRGKGDEDKARELAGRAADTHPLLTLRNAFVRHKVVKSA